MTYKGYEAKIEYDSKEMIYVGTLSNCSDLVSSIPPIYAICGKNFV